MKDVFVSSDNLLNLAKNLLSQGKVLSVVDGVVIISGLKTVKSGETLEFFDNDENVVLTGMALNLNVMTVGAVLFGDERLVKPGNVFEELVLLLVYLLVCYVRPCCKCFGCSY